MRDTEPSWLDLLASLDLIDRIEGAVFTFRYADWRGAYRRHGAFGIAVEFIRCVMALNATPHEFKRGQGISGQDMEDLLNRHGVEIGDRKLAGLKLDRLGFITKGRQGRWATWLMNKYLSEGYEPPVRRLPRRRKGWKR